MADNNVFGIIRSLATSNSNWMVSMQKTLTTLIEEIEQHVDNIETNIKNVDKSDYDVSDLENIYSIRLDVYELIINLNLYKIFQLFLYWKSFIIIN